jgi:Fe-S cluster biosynthesis and repair protein YggX
MTRLVHCRKFQKDLPGLPAPPYPGAKGQELYDTVSQQAWTDWQKQQTMLINEKHLNMANAEHRQYLQQEMEKFLDNEEHDQAEGYVPEAK